MEKLPVEMLRAIFGHLSDSDRLPVSFTCRRWFTLLKDVIPSISTIYINLDASACSTRFLKAYPSETVISICLCSEHAQQHANLLQLLFRNAGRTLTTLAIEDTLIPKLCVVLVEGRKAVIILRSFKYCNRFDNIAHSVNSLAKGTETRIADMTFHSVLNGVPWCLRALHLQGVDLSKVRPWTLAMLVKLKSLEELHLLDIVLPVDNESLFARMLSSSYDTLTSISVTNNAQITDKFAATLARRCPLLQTLDLSGCKQITSLSVLAFVENAPRRTAELTFINVHATTFSFNLLQRCLSSPLLVGGNYWKASALKLEIGFRHDTICLENIRFTNLFIVVFV